MGTSITGDIHLVGKQDSHAALGAGDHDVGAGGALLAAVDVSDERALQNGKVLANLHCVRKKTELFSSNNS